MKLTDAKVLVTGGGTGIGLETARLLTAGGARVAISGRRKDVLERAAAEVGALALVGDVSVEADSERLVASVVEAFGGYNVLVNNAGFGRFAPLVDFDVDDFDAVFATNVRGAMLMARASARHFVSQKGGNIVNVASTAASRGAPNGTAYHASKFALAGLTQVWRAELRPHNVRVMQVNPSEVLTDFFAAAGGRQEASDRKLRPAEIAHAIRAMLEMDDRGFVTELTVFATNP
jgi:3-oxoacyl-[acyl-carrier protein] reductase